MAAGRELAEESVQRKAIEYDEKMAAPHYYRGIVLQHKPLDLDALLAYLDTLTEDSTPIATGQDPSSA